MFKGKNFLLASKLNTLFRSKTYQGIGTMLGAW